MNLKFELLGFCIDKDFDLKSFWVGSFTTYTLDDINGTERNLLLIGRSQGKWVLEFLGKWICGPKESFINE